MPLARVCVNYSHLSSRMAHLNPDTPGLIAGSAACEMGCEGQVAGENCAALDVVKRQAGVVSDIDGPEAACGPGYGLPSARDTAGLLRPVKRSIIHLSLCL